MPGPGADTPPPLPIPSKLSNERLDALARPLSQENIAQEHLVMKLSLPLSTLLPSLITDFRRAWKALLLFEVLFKFLEAWLFVPVITLLLSLVLSRAGHLAVSNRDILEFLFSPLGWLYASLAGTLALAVLLLEQAGILLLAHAASPSAPPLHTPSLWTSIFRLSRLAELGALKLFLLALTLAPFVLLALLTYGLLLSHHDINFYLANRPPVFWLAAILGCLLALSAFAVSLFLYVRWAFALPIFLFEHSSPRAALPASADRVRGAGWSLAFLLLGWHALLFLLAALLLAGFRLVAASLLDRAGERPVLLLLLLLLLQAGLITFLSFLHVVGQALLTRRLYLHRCEQLALLPPSQQPSSSPTEPAHSPRSRRLAYLALAVILLAPLALWADLFLHLAEVPLVKITAHRGHSRAAPENTLSAIRKAISSGADYAEIDVQRTADGVIVLLHDRDLKRVAGDPRTLAELTYDAVRQLDVGSFFSPSFADERVPSLAEVIRLSRGRIRLNIELKVYGSDLRLAHEVAQLVQQLQFESECILTTFHSPSLAELRREYPRLRTGLIVAHALGDASRLDVDLLSVRADWLTENLLRQVQSQGKEVHVWTVNDPAQMTRFLKLGVDNILTDDPDILVSLRHDWASLSGPERLLLASRVLLGLNP